MLIITKNANTVRIQIPEALANASARVPHREIYILRDKASFVALDYLDRWVTVRLVDGTEWRLDINAKNGLPVSKVDGTDITSNEQLCRELSKLKSL
tara:strand:+ start:587 stop:877 length:291 start_codon:yes stop_codon:yes gene_type:complete